MDLISFDNLITKSEGGLLRVPDEASKLKLELIHDDFEKDFLVTLCCYRWSEPLFLSFICLIKLKGLPIDFEFFQSMSKGRSVTQKYEGITVGQEHKLRVDFKHMAARVGKKGLIPTMCNLKPSRKSMQFWSYLDNQGLPHCSLSREIEKYKAFNSFLKAKTAEQRKWIFNKMYKSSALENEIKQLKMSLSGDSTNKGKSKMAIKRNSEKSMGRKRSKLAKNTKALNKIKLRDFEPNFPGDCNAKINLTPDYKPLSEKYKQALQSNHVPLNYQNKLIEQEVLKFAREQVSQTRDEMIKRLKSKTYSKEKNEQVLENIKRKSTFTGKNKKVYTRKRHFYFRREESEPISLNNKFEVLNMLEDKIDAMMGENEVTIKSAEPMTDSINFERLREAYSFASHGKNPLSKRSKFSRKKVLYHLSDLDHPKSGKILDLLKKRWGTGPKVNVSFNFIGFQKYLEGIANTPIINQVRFRGKIVDNLTFYKYRHLHIKNLGKRKTEIIKTRGCLDREVIIDPDHVRPTKKLNTRRGSLLVDNFKIEKVKKPIPKMRVKTNSGLVGKKVAKKVRGMVSKEYFTGEALKVEMEKLIKMNGDDYVLDDDVYEKMLEINDDTVGHLFDIGMVLNKREFRSRIEKLDARSLKGRFCNQVFYAPKVSLLLNTTRFMDYINNETLDTQVQDFD